MTFFIIGHDAFPLRTWLMKPFSRRNMEMDEYIFNCRLSRASRVSENAFGIMANRCRCLLKPQEQNPKIVESIVSACCCLHNLCHIRYPGNPPLDRDNANHERIPGEWGDNADLTELQRLRGNVGSRAAKRQRLISRSTILLTLAQYHDRMTWFVFIDFKIYLCVK